MVSNNSKERGKFDRSWKKLREDEPSTNLLGDAQFKLVLGSGLIERKKYERKTARRKGHCR